MVVQKYPLFKLEREGTIILVDLVLFTKRQLNNKLNSAAAFCRVKSSQVSLNCSTLSTLEISNLRLIQNI